MNATEMEHRLATLEKEVALLKSDRAKPGPQNRWWEQIAGTFAGDPIFEDAMRLGRQWRQSQRPKSPKARKGKTRK